MRSTIKVAALILTISLWYSSLAVADQIELSTTVPFTTGSTTFNPDIESSTFLARAAEASMVIIDGRTSTDRFSHKDELLALKRAVSARDYLVGKGVNPFKIYINWVSAAGFIVDNSTPAGKAANQRVDIKMIFNVR